MSKKYKEREGIYDPRQRTDNYDVWKIVKRLSSRRFYEFYHQIIWLIHVNQQNEDHLVVTGVSTCEECEYDSSYWNFSPGDCYSETLR